MTLVTRLFNSRTFDHKTNTVDFQGDLVNLVKQLEQKAKSTGLTLSRWQTNGYGGRVSITWALHSGDRPSFSRDLPDDAQVVVLSQLEGKTKQCEAYKALSTLL